MPPAKQKTATAAARIRNTIIEHSVARKVAYRLPDESRAEPRNLQVRHCRARPGSSRQSRLVWHRLSILSEMAGTGPAMTTQCKWKFSEISVRWPLQAEILAQGLSLVFAPEQSPPLQLRHHAVDEIVEAAGEVREHHGESIAGFRREPLLHLVGDARRRADDRQPGIAAEPLRQLPHGQLLALRQIDRALASALAGVALRDVGQRLIRIEARRVVAERDR